MNLWLSPDWDRGYEAGRKAGLEEARKAKPGSLKNIEFDTDVLMEQQRIIKLLEEKFDCGDPKCIHDECCFSEEAIALIKGEQK